MISDEKPTFREAYELQKLTDDVSACIESLVGENVDTVQRWTDLLYSIQELNDRANDLGGPIE